MSTIRRKRLFSLSLNVEIQVLAGQRESSLTPAMQRNDEIINQRSKVSLI